MTEYGKWIKEVRAADCPQCHSDSRPVRLSNDRTVELRRCEEGHEFESQAWETCAPAVTERPDLA